MKISEVIRFLENAKDILGDIDVKLSGSLMTNGRKRFNIDFPKITISVEGDVNEPKSTKQDS